MPPVTRALNLSFLGFNPLGGGFDGRGLIDQGADRTFSSLDLWPAMTFLRQHFRHVPPPWPVRLTGYSYGGWTALLLAHHLSRRFEIRIGLVDPVRTFRVDRRRAGKVRQLGSRPCAAHFAINVFQRKGLIARFNRGAGWRMPMRARWFASGPLPGFDNRDVSDQVSEAAGHVEVAERFAAEVARQTFTD